MSDVFPTAASPTRHTFAFKTPDWSKRVRVGPAGYQDSAAVIIDERAASPASQDASPEGARGRAVLHGDGAVHEDPVDPLGGVVRAVLERVRVGPQIRRAVPHA